MKYRKLLLQRLLSQINKEDIDLSSLKKANLLDPVYWIDQSWSQVNEECIKNCWRHAGFVLNDIEEEIIPENAEDGIEDILSRVTALNLIVFLLMT